MTECIDHGKAGHKKHGYAMVWFDGKSINAHRLAYCVKMGVLPEAIKGQVVRHTCDNQRCVNPDHLVIGSYQDNMDDKVSRNRQTKGTAIIHAVLTPEVVESIRNRLVKRCPVNGASAMAREYNVAVSTIIRAAEGRTWHS